MEGHEYFLGEGSCSELGPELVERKYGLEHQSTRELGHVLHPQGQQCWHLHNPRGAGIRLLGNICCFCCLFPWMCSRISRPLDRPLAAVSFLQILETQCGTNHDLSCGIFLGKPPLPVRNPCGKKKPEIQKDFGWPLLSHN